tara:strand:- start:2479 stop:3279 length:801 start_codon:yes stop_codon:yes gene_type:complete
MKLVITGGDGYIGRRLQEKLKNTEHKIFAPTYKKWDITTESRMDFSVDCVIHLAGLVKVNESIKNPLDYYNVNIIGTANVVKSYPKAKVILASTGAAFNPTSPYARSKLAAEDVVRSLSNNYTIFRFFNIGGGQPTNPVGLHAATLKALESKEFTIAGSDWNTKDGTCVRDYVHIDDVCNAIIKAINLPSANSPFEPIGSGKEYTILEYINTFLKVNGSLFNIKYGPRRPGDNEESKLPFLSTFMEPKKTLEDIVRLDENFLHKFR